MSVSNLTMEQTITKFGQGHNRYCKPSFCLHANKGYSLIGLFFVFDTKNDTVLKYELHTREKNQMSKSEDTKKAVKKKPLKTAKEKKQAKQEKKKNR